MRMKVEGQKDKIAFLYNRNPKKVWAVKMTKEVQESKDDWLFWMFEAWDKHKDEIGSLYYSKSAGCLFCRVSWASVIRIDYGDYLISDDGLIYTTKEKEFENAYKRDKSNEKSGDK